MIIHNVEIQTLNGGVELGLESFSEETQVCLDCGLVSDQIPGDKDRCDNCGDLVDPGAEECPNCKASSLYIRTTCKICFGDYIVEFSDLQPGEFDLLLWLNTEPF